MKLFQAILIMILASILLLSAGSCGSEKAAAKDGDVVRVHYTLRLEDGTVFDSSEGKDPLEFTVGSDSMIQGFDRAVVGMKPGETKTVTIPPEEAYGLHRDDLVRVEPRDELPGDIELELGMLLQGSTPSGGTINYIVTDITDYFVTLDANHVLAGETLTFDIELVKIVE